MAIIDIEPGAAFGAPPAPLFAERVRRKREGSHALDTATEALEFGDKIAESPLLGMLITGIAGATEDSPEEIRKRAAQNALVRAQEARARQEAEQEQRRQMLMEAEAKVSGGMEAQEGQVGAENQVRGGAGLPGVPDHSAALDSVAAETTVPAVAEGIAAGAEKHKVSQELPTFEQPPSPQEMAKQVAVVEQMRQALGGDPSRKAIRGVGWARALEDTGLDDAMGLELRRAFDEAGLGAEDFLIAMSADETFDDELLQAQVESMSDSERVMLAFQMGQEGADWGKVAPLLHSLSFHATSIKDAILGTSTKKRQAEIANAWMMGLKAREKEDPLLKEKRREFDARYDLLLAQAEKQRASAGAHEALKRLRDRTDPNLRRGRKGKGGGGGGGGSRWRVPSEYRKGFQAFPAADFSSEDYDPDNPFGATYINDDGERVPVPSDAWSRIRGGFIPRKKTMADLAFRSNEEYADFRESARKTEASDAQKRTEAGLKAGSKAASEVLKASEKAARRVKQEQEAQQKKIDKARADLHVAQANINAAIVGINGLTPEILGEILTKDGSPTAIGIALRNRFPGNVKEIQNLITALSNKVEARKKIKEMTGG